MRKGIIYKATNKLTGKVYIGQTVQKLINRKNRHFRDSINKPGNCKFHNALNKYDNSNFDWEILGEYSSECLDEKEAYYISFYNSVKEGYNILLGGQKTNRGNSHWNYKDVKYTFYHTSGITERCTPNQLYVKYNLCKSNIHKVSKGVLKSYLGWSIIQGYSIPLPVLRDYIHSDGTVELQVTIYYMVKKYNLSRTSMRSLCKNKIKQTSGWKLV